MIIMQWVVLIVGLPLEAERVTNAYFCDASVGSALLGFNKAF